jgi:hypothetical protein
LASSIAAGRAAARRLHGSHESTHEFAIHLRGNCIDIDVLPSKKFTSVFNPINSGWFDFNLLKSSGRELDTIVILFESPGDTANPQKNAGATNLQGVMGGMRS